MPKKSYINKICALFLVVFASGCSSVSPGAPKSENLTAAALVEKSVIQTEAQRMQTISPEAPTKKYQVQNLASMKDGETLSAPGEAYDLLSARESALLGLMQGYLGKRDGGDCSGFVTLINQKFGQNFFDKDELDKFYTKRGLKSEAMFRLYESKNLIAFDSPQIGDLIFFNNTTKRTKNNKKTKTITHVGIVSSVEKDGTVGFTHHTKGKNAVDFMNLNHKNARKKGKKEINSYVATCKVNDASCLASNRFSGFGKTKARVKKTQI